MPQPSTFSFTAVSPNSLISIPSSSSRFLPLSTTLSVVTEDARELTRRAEAAIEAAVAAAVAVAMSAGSREAGKRGWASPTRSRWDDAHSSVGKRPASRPFAMGLQKKEEKIGS